MPNKTWDEIAYPFPNFNGVHDGIVEASEWMTNFIPHLIGQLHFKSLLTSFNFNTSMDN